MNERRLQRRLLARLQTREDGKDLVLYEGGISVDDLEVTLEIDFHENGSTEHVRLNATELRKLDEAIGRIRKERLARGRQG